MANKTTTINTKVTVEFREHVNAFCDKHGHNRSEWVRKAIETAMKTEETYNAKFDKALKGGK